MSNTGTYVEVKTLSPIVRSALDGIDYGARDIQVVPCSSVSLQVCGGAGQRGFAVLLDLATGASKSFGGSWGGSNMFVSSIVDDSSDSGTLPPGGCVIKGTRGHPRTFATIYVHPSAMGKFLPSGEAESTTDEEQQALYCYTGIKGGEYRREELRRRGVSSACVDSLVARGYLKRSRNGATQATTKGKNALDRSRVRY